MTVTELIDKLKQLPPDAPVLVEGLNSQGPVTWVGTIEGYLAFAGVAVVGRDHGVFSHAPDGKVRAVD